MTKLRHRRRHVIDRRTYYKGVLHSQLVLVRQIQECLEIFLSFLDGERRRAVELMVTDYISDWPNSCLVSVWLVKYEDGIGIYNTINFTVAELLVIVKLRSVNFLIKRILGWIGFHVYHFYSASA